MQFQSSFVTEVLLFLKQKGESPASLSEISAYLRVPGQDARLICNIIRNKHLIEVRAKGGEIEYSLTAAGKDQIKRLNDSRNQDRLGERLPTSPA